MNTLVLTVTHKVLDHLKLQTDRCQRQIAIQEASPEIRTALFSATKDKRILLLLGNRIPFIAGDTAALWRSHNLANIAEYDALFDLLALKPDTPMRFTCEITI